MKEKIVIGSRGSKLALWQSEWVKARLDSLYPEKQIYIEIIKTSGDINTHQPLTVIGGKGVFTKELEEALLDNRIDLAVHSLKDLPTILPDGLLLSAITKREDPRDALILRVDLEIENPSINNLPQGSIVGTSSQRRMVQIKAIRPDIEIRDLRGNIDTRLRKLDSGEYDAIILASAGLHRLGWSERISAAIAPDEMLPAVGQGALGLETRQDDKETAALIQELNHPKTNIACKAERAFLRGLGGGCQQPIGGHAVVENNRVFLAGLLASSDFTEIRRDKIEGEADDSEMLGETLAKRLLN